jgi:hypothetical protein
MQRYKAAGWVSRNGVCPDEAKKNPSSEAYKRKGPRMKRVAICVVLVAVFVLGGCFTFSSSLAPTHVPLGQHDMTRVSSKAPISIINRQEIKQTQIEIRDIGPVQFDLSSWSDQAIKLISEWLEYNAIPIDKNASKKIFVSVLNPRSERPGSFRFDLRLETSSGTVRTFNTEATAFANARAIGYAINWGVVKAIHDPDILSFMEK